MPEIKHNFTGGKMNKDLDKRLIPNGDYRHAMNIQVSTSDGSSVGSIQSLLGNEFPKIGQQYIPNGSVCVGSIEDEKNDRFYWFTTEGSFKAAFDNPDQATSIGLNVSVEQGINQQGQGNPWGASYWSAPLDGLNGTATKFFSSLDYIIKRTNTIHRLTEIHNPNQDYDYKVETVFLDDAGSIIQIWNPAPAASNLSQTNTANDLFASGTDINGNTVTCAPNSGCSAFDSTFLSGHSSYGFVNNGFGYGSSNGPVPGVNTKYQLNIYDARTIKIGDKVQGIGFNPWSDSLGYEPYRNFFKEDTHVVNKTIISNWVDHAGEAREHSVITLNNPIGLIWYNAITDELLDDVAYSPSSGLTAKVLVTHLHFDHSVLQFSDENLITGVNIIDDMLFWTDNNTEPKKINISRSIQGTQPDISDHTRLINEAENIDFSSGIDIREEHITVIKKAPKSPPKITVQSGRDEDLNYSGIFYTQEPGSSDDSSFLESSGAQSSRDNFSGLNIGDHFIIKLEERIDGLYPFNDTTSYAFNTTAGGATGYPINYNTLVNSDVVIKNCSEIDGTTQPGLPLLENWVIKGKIIPWSRNNFAISDPNPNLTLGRIGFKIEILAMNETPPVADSLINGGRLNYVVDLFDKTEKIFEFKFPRFAYRYQYEDGELSTFSPFSEVGFLPGNYTFEPNQGYNLGMTNTASSIDIENFKTQDIPLDVTRIDLLYKDDASPVIYLIDSIRPNDHNTIVNEITGDISNAWNIGKYTITEESISSVVPSNQLLRSWDNVPRKALAQEVSGNRVIYGNYLQNYNLNTIGEPGKFGEKAHASFKHSLVNHKPQDIRSIKSLREYQLGVTFLDKYGRETPVLTNPNGSFKVPKSNSINNSRLKVGLRGLTEIPENMTHYKFYIKETSNEYYNMAMDRYYDAEDGNVWLAFPSSDRNKIDIDTFLILKKGVSSSVLVKDKARYKVLAIENEAPDFIKTQKILISDAKQKHQVYDDATSTYVDNENPLFSLDSMEGSPAQGGNSFNMNWNPFSGGSGRNLDKVLDNANNPAELYVDFHNSTTGETSGRYRIAELTADWDADHVTAGHFMVKIADKGFGTDINFTCDSPSDPVNAEKIIDNIQVRIYKYQVENKPQFDGRFFVKILVDDVFETAIKIVQDGNVEYVDSAVREVYYLGKNASYMAKMAPIRSIWGGYSFNSYNHKFVGDETRLARYMAFFQLMKQRPSRLTVFYKAGVHVATDPNGLNFYGPYGNPFTGDYVDTSGSPYYDSDGYWDSTADFWTLNALHGYADSNINCNGAGSDGFCLGGYKWDVNGTWYIDGSQYYASRYNNAWYQGQDGSGFTQASAGSRGQGITNYARYDLAFGGITAHPSSTGSYVAEVDSEAPFAWYHQNPTNAQPASGGGFLYATEFDGDPYFSNNGTGIWDYQQWLGRPADANIADSISGFFNIRSTPGIYSQSAPNDYHDQSTDFPDEIQQGRFWRWEQDPTNTLTEIIGDVEEKQRSRNPAQATSNRIFSTSDSNCGWGGYGSSASWYAKSKVYADNELRPANYSKVFRFRTQDDTGLQTVHWNPTALSDQPFHGPIPGGVKMGTTDNPLSYLAGKQIKIAGAIVSNKFNSTNSTGGVGTLFSDAFVRIDNNLGYCVNNGTPQTITHQHYIITKVGSTAITNSNLLIRNVDNVSSGGVYEGIAYITGYHKQLEASDFPSSFSIGDNLELQQACMNGLSQDAADSVNESGGVGGKTIGAVGYTWKFQQALEFVEGEFLPEDPAVWETEPKDDIDIDVYYEASQTIPVNLNDSTIGTALPIGTIIKEQNNHFPLTQTVVANYDNVIEVSDTFLTDPSDSSVGMLVGDVIHSELSDGTEVGYSIDGFLYNTGAYPVAYGIIINPDIYGANVKLNWHNCYSWGNGVESNRIRDNYNQPFISNGVIVSSTLEEYAEEQKKHGLIYSGIYNSTGGVNNTNQFIAAEKITKDINPIYGSIQKLHSRSTADGDLITLCEDRVLKILANKDALFNADGNSNVTSTDNVLGQAMPFSGDYGISRNPESFASESYRVYFTDKIRGAVIRLSKDGLTPISKHGMKDWFRDHLRLADKIHGSYDDKKEEYNVTLKFPGTVVDDNKINNTTVSFREDVKGWVSFKSFTPENALSCANEYYTIKNGLAWHHHVDLTSAGSSGCNNFYNVFENSRFEVIFNENSTAIKSFKTLNYEGTQSKVRALVDPITGGPLRDGLYHNLFTKQGWYVESVHTEQDTGSLAEFINKEDKWFNYIYGEQLNVTAYYAENYDSGDFAHQGIGKTIGPAQDVTVAGCMDDGDMGQVWWTTNYAVSTGISVYPAAVAFNYDPLATIEDGSCVPVILGCLQIGADNYNPLANTSDGSCSSLGCMDNTTINGCGLGCNGAINYNPLATTDDGLQCEYCVLGCTDHHMFNYDALATCDDGSCIPFVYGCTDNYNSNVTNYNDLANTDDGSCEYTGCIDPNAANAFFVVPTDNLYGFYNDDYLGCYSNTPPENIYPFQITLQYPYPGPGAGSDFLTMVNSDLSNNGVSNITYIPACPTIDDGSCEYDGCMDDGQIANSVYPPYPAVNYDPTATVGSISSCLYCGDAGAANYDYADSNTSYDACLYCPDLQSSLIVDNETDNSFDITWEVPSDLVLIPSSGGPINVNEWGLHYVRIYWGVSTEVPPYNGVNPNNYGGGYFQYNPYDFDLNASNYPAITDNGDGTLTITVSMGQIPNGILVPAPGIQPETQYSIVVDTFCQSVPESINTPLNVLHDTTFTNSNTVSQVTITTTAVPPPTIEGCTDETAFNYDPTATVDDGSCIPVILGCMDDGYCDDGTLGYIGYHPCYNVAGNTYLSPFNGVPADNYDATANTDDGLCDYIGCTDPNDCAYSAAYTTTCVDDNGVSNGNSGGCCGGCGDPIGLNYDASNSSGCTDCVYCPILPTTSDPATQAIGVSVYWNNTSIQYTDSNGISQTHVGIDVKTSFPIGFDFSLVEPDVGWASSYYNIRLKIKEVGVVGFDTYNMQIPLTSPPTPGNVVIYSFLPYSPSGNQYNPRIKFDTAYEFGTSVLCERDDGVAVAGTDGLWWPLQIDFD